jgi:hypothetical protein
MASERDFELLDDYIGNRLSSEERAQFEGKLQGDPELQRELKLQQGIVDSLRKARAAELKARLNNIPVNTVQGSSSLAKWAGGAMAVVVAVGLYFYLQPDPPKDIKPASESVTSTQPAAKEQPEAMEPAKTTEVIEPKVDPSVEKQKSQATKPITESAVRTPDLDVFDPTAETVTESSIPEQNAASTENSATDVKSEVITDHKEYKFHYRLKDDKLVLYGAFDKNLYEILEFISDQKQTVFLSYKNNFYLLNQGGDKVRPLSPVNDPVLIRKLKEYQEQR